MTNEPLAELLGIPGVQEWTTNLSPTSGVSKLVVRIADDEGKSWEVAFPSLVDVEEDDNPEHRS